MSDTPKMSILDAVIAAGAGLSEETPLNDAVARLRECGYVMMPITTVDIWRHKKSGGCYEIVGTGHFQSVDKDLDEALTVTYRSLTDGKLWTRFASEFLDGRFEQVSSPDESALAENFNYFPTLPEPDTTVEIAGGRVSLPASHRLGPVIIRTDSDGSITRLPSGYDSATMDLRNAIAAGLVVDKPDLQEKVDDLESRLQRLEMHYRQSRSNTQTDDSIPGYSTMTSTNGDAHIYPTPPTE